ncbi:Membrane protein involved in the export of O-antigen and teichoic acid [Rhizobium sp. RU20A]|uniref:polysaccharide biosynthesis C-terminal domain-containing protein n=1 Tax=Rhizobium sp. RU20A TaxID=1907412 RepID=UPI00095428B4|nr:lipopolysaccharide biosynthesis protein [Rhizobium sp. RU20A]SIR11695.1 Membrane protein involved in the export of O-antigen and teichoic acid [Rhizobium sp. RU20A]
MLLKQTWQYLPAQIIAPAVQIISVLVWAHLLPLEEVGKVTLVVAMQDVLFAGLFMWWSHFALRFLPRFATQEQRRGFLDTELTALAGSSVLQLLIMLIVSHFYFHEPPTPLFYVSVTAFVLVRSLSTYLAERARADVRILLYTTLQAAFPALGLLLSIIVCFYVSASAEYVLLATMLPQLAGVVMVVLVTDIGRGGARPDKAMLKSAFAFGLPLTVGSMLAVVALNAPRFIVDRMLGIAATGIFAVSYGLGIRASSFAVMLVTAGAYPLAVRKMEEEGLEAAYRQLSANMILVALTVAPVACGLIGINTSVIRIFLPETMWETAYVLLPLSTLCGLFRYLRSHTTDQVFLIRSKPRYVTMIATIDLVLAVSLTFVGLSLFGLWGAVLGPLVTAALTWATSLLITQIRFGFPFPGSVVLRIIAAAVIMMLVVLELPTTESPLVLAGQVGLGCVIYIAVLALFFPTYCAVVLRRLRAKLLTPKEVQK